jgi:hypothetical protein
MLQKATKFVVTPEEGHISSSISTTLAFVNRAIATTKLETQLGLGGSRLSKKFRPDEVKGRTVAFDLIANTPKKPDAHMQLEKRDGVFLLWTYYRDGYGIGRSGGNIGTYMGLGNFSPTFRNFSEAISTLNHHPQGFNSYDSTAQIRKDSGLLRKGLKMWKVGEDDWVDVIGVLGIAKTDSQELLKYLNHGSFKNHGCCPHCQVCVSL